MDFDRPSRWDFPVFAMTTAKLNKPETAIDMLLFQNKHNSYESPGHNSRIYFPANGGLFSAIATLEAILTTPKQFNVLENEKNT